MTEIQGKSILARVRARFELARVRITESRLYFYFDELSIYKWTEPWNIKGRFPKSWGLRASVSSSPLPLSLPPCFFFCSRSNFRAVTRLETFATQAIIGVFLSGNLRGCFHDTIHLFSLGWFVDNTYTGFQYKNKKLNRGQLFWPAACMLINKVSDGACQGIFHDVVISIGGIIF